MRVCACVRVCECVCACLFLCAYVHRRARSRVCIVRYTPAREACVHMCVCENVNAREHTWVEEQVDGRGARARARAYVRVHVPMWRLAQPKPRLMASNNS